MLGRRPNWEYWGEQAALPILPSVRIWKAALSSRFVNAAASILQPWRSCSVSHPFLSAVSFPIHSYQKKKNDWHLKSPAGVFVCRSCRSLKEPWMVVGGSSGIMNLLPFTEDVTAFTYCKFLKEEWCTHSCRMGSRSSVSSQCKFHRVFCIQYSMKSHRWLSLFL
jgi:hypothetical protein